jgi:hypothetical protein
MCVLRDATEWEGNSQKLRLWSGSVQRVRESCSLFGRFIVIRHRSALKQVPHCPELSWILWIWRSATSQNISATCRVWNCQDNNYTLALFCAFFALTPLSNLHHFLIYTHFPCNSDWLAAFCYSDALFLMGISVMIYAYFFRNTSRA